MEMKGKEGRKRTKLKLWRAAAQPYTQHVHVTSGGTISVAGLNWWDGGLLGQCVVVASAGGVVASPGGATRCSGFVGQRGGFEN